MTESGPRRTGGHNQRLGASGEDLAARWYRRRGFRVVDRNWRSRNGELDLVVSGRGELIICEVKTRSSRRFGHPAEAVTEAKQRRIRSLALEYVEATGARGHLRFDVATVERGTVQVWAGVF